MKCKFIHLDVGLTTFEAEINDFLESIKNTHYVTSILMPETDTSLRCAIFYEANNAWENE